MTETSNGSGIYEWQSPDTIANMKPDVGVYYARVAASNGISLTTQMMAFHVDPPAPSTGIAVPESLLEAILILAIGGLLMGAIFIKKRRTATMN